MPAGRILLQAVQSLQEDEELTRVRLDRSAYDSRIVAGAKVLRESDAYGIRSLHLW
jgi:hypothetical protein